ncbi:hypothetical protein BH09PAT3_BH09PAT3_5240 [soil metagenome]
MIQFNLLPDVKLAYIKAERTKRMVVSISVLASAVSLFVFIALLLTVNFVQKKNLSDLNADIKTDTAKLQNTPNLNKILTIQNQLSVLTGLHEQKPVGSRLFTYLGQVTPSSVTVSNATTDFQLHTIAVNGEGANLDAVNTFVDTLKFTTYTTDKNTTPTKAFSDVVLANFSRTANGANYNLTLTYDPEIFNVANEVKLTVPNTVTTRSVTEQPAALFKNTEEAQ